MENSDSDPEYEVGEKRKKTKHGRSLDDISLLDNPEMMIMIKMMITIMMITMMIMRSIAVAGRGFGQYWDKVGCLPSSLQIIYNTLEHLDTGHDKKS